MLIDERYSNPSITRRFQTALAHDPRAVAPDTLMTDGLLTDRADADGSDTIVVEAVHG